MNEQNVFELLEQHKNQRGIDNWLKLHGDDFALTSYGIGLTVHRKLAKKIGRNRELAQQLWQSNNYDAKVIALLIDDPKQITKAQAEQQVEQLHGGFLAHVFSSCDATLAKTSFVIELLEDWIESADEVRVRCGYGLLYEVAKWKKKSAPDDRYFLDHINKIAQRYKGQSTNVLMAMAGALLGIGGRNITLNTAALELAREIGPITFSDTCDPTDVAKNLTSDAMKRKLGIR